MSEHKLNFEAWRQLAKNDPRNVAKRFAEFFEPLTEESKKAFIAAHHDSGFLTEKNQVCRQWSEKQVGRRAIYPAGPF